MEDEAREDETYFTAHEEHDAAEAGYHSKIILLSKYKEVDIDETARVQASFAKRVSGDPLQVPYIV